MCVGSSHAQNSAARTRARAAPARVDRPLKWSYDVTMEPLHKTVPAARFKAECLALLDRVARTGETLVVTKRGQPVARVVPIDPAPGATLRGSVTFRGDVVGPILDGWNMEE